MISLHANYSVKKKTLYKFTKKIALVKKGK